MSVIDVGKRLVELCNQGEFQKAVSSLYDENIVSWEGPGTPEPQMRMEGLGAIERKNQWWAENHEVHEFEAIGPFVGHRDDQFAVHFELDVTPRETGERTRMSEVGLYTVKDGKVVQEEFLYRMR